MLQEIINQLPEFAKDIKLNVSSIINNHSLLTEQQFAGLLLAVALTKKDKQLIAAIKHDYATILDEKLQNGVHAAHAIMSMTNIYYKFINMVGKENYSTIPAGLRMNILRDPGIDKIDFELYSLAVSIVNGCEFCIKAHEAQLSKHGVAPEVIQVTAKISAIMNSLSAISESSYS